MDIARRFRGGFTVLDLTGRFVVSPGEGEIQPLRSAIRALIAEARVDIALNLAGLTNIDARGLGELVFRVYSCEVDAVRGSPVHERESSAYEFGLP